MFKLNSEKELLECFRLLDRDEVIPPRDLSFPLIEKNYLAWLEPSGCRVYLVFNERLTTAPMGIVFRRDSGGNTLATMCEWCHSVRSGEDIGLLSATASSKRRIGIHLCRDLSCKDKIEGVPSAHDFPESANQVERLRKVVARMGDFARRELY